MAVIYEAPEFYKLARAQVDPVEPNSFRRVHDLVEDVVAANLCVEYRYVTDSGEYFKHTPPSYRDLRDGLLYEDERNGFTRLDGRMVDTRIFSPSKTIRQTVGATAFVGIALTPTSPIESLWVMSSDGTNHWMLEHDALYTISDFEIDRLETDLTKLVRS